MKTVNKAAHDLAELMLRMRIEVRKLAFDERTGHVGDVDWHKVYNAIRRFEDAQVQDMLQEPGRQRRRKRRIRRDEEKAKSVPTEKRRKPKTNHPRRSGFSPNAKPRT